MYSKDGVYNLFRELHKFLKHPTPGVYKKFMQNDLDYFTTHYYDKTPRWSEGANNYITLANALNSGQIKLLEVVAATIGKYVIEFKHLTNYEYNNIDRIKILIKFYTILETKKHFEYIKKLEENTIDVEDTFFEFTKNKIDVYKVNEEQKNMLYDLVREGKVNFFCFIYAWMKGKFDIDESKITDPDYKKFIQCMSIVRHNITKK